MCCSQTSVPSNPLARGTSCRSHTLTSKTQQYIPNHLEVSHSVAKVTMSSLPYSKNLKSFSSILLSFPMLNGSGTKTKIP